MKTTTITTHCVVLLLAIQCAWGQSLSEKKYDPAEGEQVFTTVENVPSVMGSGQVMVTSRTGAGTGENTVVVLVNDQGVIQWETIYDNTGTFPFDHEVYVKNHRIGFHPDSETILITGKGGNGDPTFIELDYATGDVLDEYYYEEVFSEIYEGHLSAIHSVMSGTHAGAYMVGGYRNLNDGYSPLITKVGGAGEFQLAYQDLDDMDPRYNYLDVDVDNTEGYVIAVGLRSADRIDFGQYGIVDVFETDGTPVGHYEYLLADTENDLGRFTAVKCVAPGRVVIGGMRNETAYLMQINYLTGAIHWSRYVTGSDEEEIAEIIEVEQDDEGSIVMMGIATPHWEGQEPDGPGFIARLYPNGLVDWSITEEMIGGYGDLEPQYTADGLLAMLTGIEDAGFRSRLTYLNPTNGFYGCQTELTLEAVSEPENTWSAVSRTFMAVDNYIDIDPDFDEADVATEEGCCWLPYFNPLVWNHPWETTYYSNSAVIDVYNGSFPSYIYQWGILVTKNIYTGEAYFPTPSTGGTNNSEITLGLINTASPVKHPERNRIYVIASEDNTEGACKGRDDGAVTIVQDGHDVVRPDYTNTTYGNQLQHHNYTYCQQSAGTDRYLYQHRGEYLGSQGFEDNASNALSFPNIVNPSSGTNYLSSSGVKLFYETVEDDFQAGSTRVIRVETDVNVVNCATSCAPGLSLIGWTAENGNRMFSISSGDLDGDAGIVKYAFSLHLNDGSMEDHKMIKRLEMVNHLSGSIIGDDHLIPVVDERYMKGNAAYNVSVLNDLYLDAWFSSDAAYDYDIDCHERYKIDLAAGVASRLAAPGQEGERAAEVADLSVYPNPSRDVFRLQGLEGAVSMQVYNAGGRLVWEHTVTVAAGSSELIDLREMPAGLYVLKVQMEDGGTAACKLMKE